MTIIMGNPVKGREQFHFALGHHPGLEPGSDSYKEPALPIELRAGPLYDPETWVAVDDEFAGVGHGQLIPKSSSRAMVFCALV